MSNYTPLVNYAAKDALSTGDPAKRILGTEITAELNAIATMSATKEDLANKNINSGYAGLDSAARIAKAQGHTQTAYKDEATVFTLSLELENASPIFSIDETDGGTNARHWLFRAAGGSLFGSTALDASPATAFENWFQVSRNASGEVTAIAFSGDAFTYAGVSIRDAAILNAGTLPDARIAVTGVTQHQASLAIGTGQVTSGTFADARIAQSNVTQHQAALAITGPQVTPPLRTVAGAATVASGDREGCIIITAAGNVTLGDGHGFAVGQSVAVMRDTSGAVSWVVSGSQTREAPGARFSIPEENGWSVATYIATNRWAISGT